MHEELQLGAEISDAAGSSGVLQVQVTIHWKEKKKEEREERKEKERRKTESK